MGSGLRIAIVGGGLAGLCTAKALDTFDLRADVFEAASDLREAGAALNTSPNATKVLLALGLGEQLPDIGSESLGIFTRNMQTGEPLEFHDRRKEPVQYGAPHYNYHRADLLDLLAKSIDPASVHLGHRLTAIEEGHGAVMLRFANGAAFEADCVIGADGIRSVVRRTLYGDDNPTYTGVMVWRALLKASEVLPEVLEPTGHIQWVGPGRHLLAYYIRHGELVNIVTQEETDQWVAEGWSTRGDPDEMRRSFPNAEPRLEKLLGIVTECSKWGLFTRPINENWGYGRIQLIGDAAHAMLPNAGQGACQAFEDAYILARWMAAESDPASAFANFRRIRIPRVHAVQRISVVNGKFKHMHDSSAQKALIVSGKGSVQGYREFLWRYDPIAEWNKQPTVPVIESAAA